MATNQYILLDGEKDKDEFDMIKEFSKLMGLKNTTALKLHLRQTLPNEIKKIKELSDPSDVDSPSHEILKDT